ncbi:MAG: hypothetical protein Q4D02_04065 [Clostridia bacterium]|nr:hypothetical protein [Clostridia bacterium]
MIKGKNGVIMKELKGFERLQGFDHILPRGIDIIQLKAGQVLWIDEDGLYIAESDVILIVEHLDIIYDPADSQHGRLWWNCSDVIKEIPLK